MVINRPILSPKGLFYKSGKHTHRTTKKNNYWDETPHLWDETLVCRELIRDNQELNTSKSFGYKNEKLIVVKCFCKKIMVLELMTVCNEQIWMLVQINSPHSRRASIVISRH